VRRWRMRRLILTPERLLELPNGLSHREFVRGGGPDGLRLRDYGDVVFVHLEALLDRDAEEVQAMVQAALDCPVRVRWYS
jgi:hypothetical protein